MISVIWALASPIRAATLLALLFVMTPLGVLVAAARGEL